MATLNDNLNTQFDHDSSGGNLNDNIIAFLKNKGKTGTLNDMLYSWATDEGGTGTLNDRLKAAFGTTGTLNDRMKSWVAFSNTYSLDFDGTDDYVNCGNDSSLQISGDITCSCWLKTSSADSPMSLIDKLGSNTGMFIFLSSGKPRIWIGTGSAIVNYENIGSDLRDGAWHHLVVVNDEDVATYVYIDGTAYNNGTATDMAVNTANNFNIGSYSTTSWIFEGKIDEVAIWNSALTASEITAIYNSGTPIALDSDSGNYSSSADLQGWWRMEEGSGSSVADSSDNTNTGTITGATFSTDVP